MARKHRARPGLSFTIRPYRPSDQASVEWLYSRTPPAGQIAWRPIAVPEDLKHPLDYYAGFWVAVAPLPVGEAMVGITGLERLGAGAIDDVPVPEFIPTPEPSARIHHVAVAPECWRQGVGSGLVRTTVDWARGNGYRSIVVDTTIQQTAAVALYEKLGFAHAGNSMFGEYECAWFRLVLQAADHSL